MTQITFSMEEGQGCRCHLCPGEFMCMKCMPDKKAAQRKFILENSMLDVFIDTPEMDEFVGKFSKENYDFALNKLRYEQYIQKGGPWMTPRSLLKKVYNIDC